MQKHKPFPDPIPPLEPERRAQAIRDAIAKRKIKRTEYTDDILELLDQIVAIREP